jgi:hypothetical protein
MFILPPKSGTQECQFSMDRAVSYAIFAAARYVAATDGAAYLIRA